MKLRHTAHVEASEDCSDMVVFKSSLSPIHRGSGSSPANVFEEVKDAN